MSRDDTKPRNKPIKIMIISAIGSILRKDFPAIFRDFIAFFLSLINAIKKLMMAMPLITITVIFMEMLVPLSIK